MQNTKLLTDFLVSRKNTFGRVLIKVMENSGESSVEGKY